MRSRRLKRKPLPKEIILAFGLKEVSPDSDEFLAEEDS
jgi:hypothetical protein